jgi:hypothetical protein
MTRTVYRLAVVVFVVVLAGGPLLAAPVLGRSGADVSAPGAASRALAHVAELLGGALVVFGAIRVKDAGSLAQKFATRAAAAAPDYTSGVKDAGGDWETNTKASEDNYAAGVTQAIGDKRFGKGVAAAGAAKYVNRAGTLGAQRYPSGVQASQGEWAQKTQPYLQVISSLNLPPRRPKGDPANAARAQAVASALRAAKVGR